MNAPEKRYFSEEEEQQDIEHFNTALEQIQDKLNEVKDRCLDDEILRDAVVIAVEGYCRQLEAIERACERTKDKYKSSDHDC